MCQQKKCRSGFSGQKVAAAVALIAACSLISIAAGCAGTADPKESADSAGAAPAAEPDQSRLQNPPMRFAELMPVDPQPTGGSLRSGLAVVYYFDYFARHLDPLTTGKVSTDSGVAGEPIPYLNHRFGQQEVFGSGTNRGVAMRMKGLIRFPRPGEYIFRAFSNDGLRVRIADAQIIDDPTQHSDRYAVPAVVAIRHAGWYPLTVEYFQRKGTASIGLFWLAPGAEDFAPIPAESYAHLP